MLDRVERLLAPALVLARRWRVPLAVAGWAGFVLACADAAGFVRLPVPVAVPVWLAAVATGLRYALWDGVVSPRLAARRALAPAARPGDEAA